MTSTLRDLRDMQFAQVESELLRDPTITPQCKALYSLLITYGPSSIFPGHKTLATALGVHRRSVIRWLGELRTLNLIHWRQREGTSNEYDILGYRGMTPVSQGVCHPRHRGCDTDDIGSISPQPDPPNQEESFPTDSNLPPSDPPEETPPREKPTDYLSHCAETYKRTGGKPSPTIPAAAGGADPYLDGPLVAACILLRIATDSLDADQQRGYASVIRTITEGVKEGTPQLFIRACRAWPKHGPTWKGKTCAPYSSVRGDGFRDDIQTLMRQLTSGTITSHTNIRLRND